MWNVKATYKNLFLYNPVFGRGKFLLPWMQQAATHHVQKQGTYSDMIPTIKLMFTLGVTAFLLGGCADVVGSGTGSSVHIADITPQNKAWIAFMLYHNNAIVYVAHITVPMAGPFPQVTLTQTGEEREKVFGATRSDSSGSNGQQELLNHAEEVIMATNDSDLINLHQHLKNLELTAARSPEVLRYQAALSQRETIDTAYTSTTGYQGESVGHLIERGATVSELHDVYG